MTIITTTLSTALAEGDTLVNLTSATGVTGPGPNKTTRQNIWCERECMEVQSISGTVATVVRGVNGTQRKAHVAGSLVWIGNEGDFEHFTGMDFGTYSRFAVNFETVNPIISTTGTQVLTPAMVLGGLILQDPGGAANDTLPTAAQLITALQSVCKPYIGLSFCFTIQNTADGAEAITVVVGTGITAKGLGTLAIAQSNTKSFRLVCTGVDVPAFDLYSLGTVVS